MENSKTQEKIISLGKLLIAELEQEPGTDFLCRWMAHYLAEQITLAENAKGQKKIAARKKCFETILTLWKHQAALPNGSRPFEKFEPILHTLSDLNPENPRPYYHRLKPADKKALSKEDESVSQLIDGVYAVDSAARVLIDAMINELTKLATTKRVKAMLSNAPEAAKKKSLNPIQIMIRHMECLESGLDLANRLNEERLEKLRNFAAICKLFERLLEKKLQKKVATKKK